MNKTVSQTEWETLYNALRAVCARHGTEDPFGNADFWVVDDCWGGVTQKLIVSSARYLTPKLVDEISQCIRDTNLLGAQVVVSLDIEAPGTKLPPMGLIVDSRGALEQWDLVLLRQTFGKEFYNTPGVVLPFKPV